MNKNYPLIVVAAAVAVAVGLTACSSANSATKASSSGRTEVTTLRYQGSANAVSLPELAADLGYLGNTKLKWVGNTISGPQDIQSAATDQTDFGGAFTGAVVKLIEAGAPVKAVINYYGTDAKTFQGYYALGNSPIHSARDLIGKKIGVNTIGANAEAVIDTYLSQNGLSASEIKQVQLVVVPPNNTEEAIRKGQIDVGGLSGVLQDHAIAAGGLRSVFSDYAIFSAYNGGQYVFRDDFIKKNPDTVKTFVTAVAKAIEWERRTPREQVIAEFTKIIKGRGRNESTSNLQYWKSIGIASKGGAISDQDFTEWSDWLQSAGIIKGDALDPSKYYTNAYNGLIASGAE
ncbi:MAG: transporter substrate-binding protein [Frankiales bacterium]|nr:transporter substrate-binding protein [Frankiales bacterium]